MKAKLQLRIPAILCLLIVSLGAAFAQGGPGAPSAPSPSAGYSVPLAALGADPNTGLPSPPPRPWKDADWKDPNITLTNVFYDGLPLEEVARDLRKQFNDAFDVLIPNGWLDPNPSRSVEPREPLDLRAQSVRMQLRNVAASEVFNAMNLLFETENTPFRWELRMNGKRPAALLRVMPELLPRIAPSQIDPATGLPIRTPETKRTIQFVGDLIGDGKSGGMTMEQIVKTISEVWQMTYGHTGVVQFHKEAQLLVLSGTPDQIDFIQQTVRELRSKVELERKLASKSTEAKPMTEPMPGSPAGSK